MGDSYLLWGRYLLIMGESIINNTSVININTRSSILEI
ncbi:MAG: hypothetical protein KatS3mg083_507 [Candidatus Dojkabacteria bacterium]|nr:MAG: hypothetical protein KatS3mg083_507 [Candidatus Dojkabacteria bacterium]